MVYSPQSRPAHTRIQAASASTILSHPGKEAFKTLNCSVTPPRNLSAANRRAGKLARSASTCCHRLILCKAESSRFTAVREIGGLGARMLTVSAKAQKQCGIRATSCHAQSATGASAFQPREPGSWRIRPGKSQSLRWVSCSVGTHMTRSLAQNCHRKVNSTVFFSVGCFGTAQASREGR